MSTTTLTIVLTIAQTLGVLAQAALLFWTAKLTADARADTLKAQRLATTPLLSFQRGNPSEAVRACAWDIENVGSGAAIVTQISMEYRGVPIEPDPSDVLRRLWPSALRVIEPRPVDVRHSWQVTGRYGAIAAGKERAVARLNFKSDTDPRQIEKVLLELVIRVHYESISGEKFVASSLD